ncbi:MAG TPA: DUF1801 domain-containing protein [Trueperaceae bacterium]|nr:DUF1801 domain-containing protein [Trueperaceae bacterium]
MAKTTYATVDEYMNALEPATRQVLEEVRRALKRGVPDGEEVISYSIPAIKHNGWVFYFSAYTKHFSLSTPPPFAPFEEFKDELARYKKSKSAVQFPLSEPVPADLIERMARFQAELNERNADKKKSG